MSTIKCATWNANGLHQNLGELKTFLIQNDIDLIMINETRLTDKIKIKIKNYTILRKDRNANGGGVAIFIRNSIPFQKTKINDAVSIENISIQLQNKLNIIAVYNTPSNKFSSEDLEALFEVGNKVIVVGDLNARHTTWKNHISNTNGRTLYKFINENNIIVQHTEEPTHHPLNGMTPTFIDLIVNKNSANITDPVSLPALPSDHNPVIFNILNQYKEKSKRYVTSYKLTNWTDFRHSLNDKIKINNKIQTAQEVDKEVELLTRAIIETKHLHSKRVLVNNNSYNPDSEIKQLIKDRNAMRKLFQKRNIKSLKSDINRLNKIIRNKIRSKVNEQWEKTLKELHPGDKAMWRIAKCFKKAPQSIPTLVKNNETFLTDKSKANLISKTLEEIQTNDLVSPLENEILATVNEYFSNAQSQQRMQKIKLSTPQEIREIIRTLPNNKAPGKDEVDNKLIKNLSKKSIVQLNYIINSILKTGHYPNSWKTAIVVPIPKPNKDGSDPINYRPISLLSSLSKIAEKVILGRINKYNVVKNIIKKEQFGFRSGHSTSMQVARIANDITINFNKKNVTAVALLDIEKAFDTVYIDGLIYKLIKNEFPRYLVTILDSYLKNRNFCVKINNSISSLRHPKAGVPQGSVLGPALFNYMINDLPLFPKTKTAVYADDTAIYTHSFNAQVATKQIQIHLDMILKFAKEWKIKINKTKTEYIIFSKKFTNIKIHQPLIIEGEKIPVTKNSVKYLGVYLDKTLSFAPHINQLVKKGHGCIRLLYPLLNKYSTLSVKNKKLLYTAIIRPILTYAAPVWSGVSDTSFNKLQRIQNKCLRLVLSRDRYAKIDDLHKQTNITTIKNYVMQQSKTFYTKTIMNSVLTKQMITSNSHTNDKHKPIFHKWLTNNQNKT